MNLTSHPKNKGNMENKNKRPLNIDLSPKHQTSGISLKTSDLMLKHQKWQDCSGEHAPYQVKVSCRASKMTSHIKW